MITRDHPLIHLLLLIDMVWAEADARVRGRGMPKTFSEKTMFKVYLVSLVKKLWKRRGVWRYLKANPLVMETCGLTRVPDRRTLDRRIVEIAPHAEEQIWALGLMLSVEQVTNSATAACDGSAFQTPGPVWHKKDKEAGSVPDGLYGLDREADWIQSDYHGWVYGYKAHTTISVSSTVRVVLDATVTGSACESHVLEDRVAGLPATIETLLLDAGYDDGDLIARLAAQGIIALVPLAKAVGASTPQTRRERAAYLASEAGHAWYKQRGTSIEPFFGTIKDFFALDPLPVQGSIKASTYILMAFYAWNLIVLFNWLHDRPLGAVKSVLDCM